ncbi:MAG: 4'-phosphopantetheinyl transferase superfamily protein [Terriglobia bacterium]
MAKFNFGDLPLLASTLNGRNVHVYRIVLDVPCKVQEKLLGTLSTDEMERANRFQFEQHKHRFITAHGVVRVILARYLGEEPADLRFVYGPYGKPALGHFSKANPLYFNFSHSQGLGILSLALCDVGVDIEHIRPIEDFQALAKNHFSSCESEILNRVPPGDRLTSFYTCWTRKEAFIKAIGKGLSRPLDSFTVSLAPGDLPCLVSAEGEDASQWSILDLPVGKNWAAALAIRRRTAELNFWEWDERFTNFQKPIPEDFRGIEQINRCL